MKIVYLSLLMLLTCSLFGQEALPLETYRIYLSTARNPMLSNSVIKLDSFQWNGVVMDYLTAESGDDLNNIAERLSLEDYPFVVLRADALDQLKKMGVNYNRYYELGEQYREKTKELEALHSLEIQQLQVISDLQDQRIRTYKVLSDSLFQDVLAMSKLADEYRDVGKKAIRGQNLSKVWSGMLGGAIGFLAGIAIFDEKQ